MTVTYRDLPNEIDPINYLFGDDRFTIPKDRLDPETKVHLLEKVTLMLNIGSLPAKNKHNPYGLVSLPRLLRHDIEGRYGTWLRLEAEMDVISDALPRKTPYQLLYLPIFSFPTPRWTDIPRVTAKASWGPTNALGDITAVSLLYGRNDMLYLVRARWRPKKRYLVFKCDSEPRIDLEEGPYVFNLSHLAVEHVQWDDAMIQEKIANGDWDHIASFLVEVVLILSQTAHNLSNRAEAMDRLADRLEKIKLAFPAS